MTGLAGRAILVVEDLFYLAMDAKETLEGAGARVIGPFAASDDALRSIADRPPDCAVLDVNLGAGASFDVARALRRLGIPFVFFTGYDVSGIPEEFRDIGRLEKPVDRSRLLKTVYMCLGSSAS